MYKGDRHVITMQFIQLSKILEIVSIIKSQNVLVSSWSEIDYEASVSSWELADNWRFTETEEQADIETAQSSPQTYIQ